MTSADPMLARENPWTCSFGARTISAYLDELTLQIDGAMRMEDVENVHRLRVASRRLRAALPVFKRCMPRASYEDWRRSLKGLTTSLGLARDADVQIMFLEELLRRRGGRSMRAGLSYLLVSRRTYRKALQQDVVASLGSFRESGTIEGLKGECSRMIGLGGSQREHYSSPALRLTAQRGMKKGLEGLMALEGCVDSREAFLEHHQMRIAAKKLRYTLEMFAPLFRGRLIKSIKAFKHLQDLLGEMHDCDVWKELVLPLIKSDNKAASMTPKVEEDLGRFLSHIEARRDALYSEFRSYWHDTMVKVLGPLKEISLGPLHLPAGSFSRIALISDVHGNMKALEAVLSDARDRGARLVVSTGDLVGFGPAPDDVIMRLRKERSLIIMGNYDREVLEAGSRGWKGLKDPKEVSLRFTRSVLSSSSIDFLRSLPSSLDLKVGGRTFLLVHGSPRSDDEKLGADTDAEQVNAFLESAAADVLVSGHTHHPFARQVDKGTHINPGSVGRPGDGDPRASYAMVTLKPFSVELVRVGYDAASTAREVRKLGLPETIAQQFVAGRSLDRIIEEDELLSRKDLADRLGKVRMVSKVYLGRDQHTGKVLELSLRLFDKLVPLHGLGAGERALLECSALLHDVGWTLPGPGHHKRSMETVLNDRSLPLTTSERRVVGSVVRYHNSLPSEDHYNIASMDRRTKRTVLVLSSVLRVADALDASHGSKVIGVDVKIGPRTVALECSVSGSHDEESEGLSRKADLFERTFKRKLRVDWTSGQPC